MGCGNCDALFINSAIPEESISIPPGYVAISCWDSDGLYYILGRCYYCNHRDR